MSTRRHGAFTLFEVMLALAIVVLVAGGIFGMISATMRLTAETQARQERARKSEALGELLRNEFAVLPVHAHLLFQSSSSRQAAVSELILEDAPAAFVWGKRQAHPGAIGLLAVSRADGLLDLRLVQFNPDGPTVDDGVDWIRLAGGIRFLEWSFLGPTGQWQDRWAGGELPRLVRLRWQMQGDHEASERIFEVPAARQSTIEPEKENPDEKA